MSRVRTGLVSGVLVFVLLVGAFGPLMTGASSESEILEKPLSTHLSSSASYEAPITEWNKTFGGAGYDWAYSVQQASDGGYLIAGLTSSFGAGQSDVWLVKTDFAGNMEWNKTYGGADHDGALSVQKTSDKGYIVAGYTFSFGAGGSNDFWLIKTDADGNTQWSKTYGGTLYDKAWSVQQTTDGGYVVAGVTESFGSGVGDFWLVKTDSSGNKQWDRAFGGERYEEARSVKQTSDGGYVVAGWKRLYSYTDFWLVKTDASGYLEWDKTYGGNYDDEAYSVGQTTDGGYVTAGHLDTWYSGVRSWLVKVDSAGNMQWNQTYNGDRVYSVELTSDRGYIFAGRAGSDFLLVKADAAGDTQWSKTYGGSGSDEARCVQQTSDRGCVVAGYTNSFGAGSDDFWLIKVAPPEPTPVADFNFSPQFPHVDETVVFDASASFDRDGFIVNYKWDFGDGNITTVITPFISHAYAAPGVYAVNLTVTDSDGLNGSIIKSVTAKLSSNITLYVDPETIPLGSNAAINGTITPVRVGTNVTIHFSGPWSGSVEVTTDSHGNYSYVWRPKFSGSYEIKASWPGDAFTFPSESETKTVSVHEYVIYIRADGSIDPPTASIQRDKDVYTFTDDIYGPPIVVERNNLIIDGNGYALEGSMYGIGFDLSGRNNVTIKNTDIKGFGTSILLQRSNGNTIANNCITYMWHAIGLWLTNGNTIYGNTMKRSETSDYSEHGVYLYGSHNTSIVNNTIMNNVIGILVGDYFYSSSNNTLTDNNVTGNQLGIEVRGGSCSNTLANNYGGSIYLNDWGKDNVLRANNVTGFSIRPWNSLSYYLSQDIDISNTVNGKPIYYLVNQTNLIVDSSSFPEVGYLALINSKNTTVENLRSSVYGILLAYTTDSTVRNITVADGLGGVMLASFNCSKIVNSIVRGNANQGVYVDSLSNNLIICGNNITDNDQGVVTYSNNILFSRNNIADNKGAGVHVNGKCSILSENNITENANGIVLDWGAQNTTIHRNNIKGNSIGISDAPIFYPSSNKIYHNNFVGNTQHVSGYGTSLFNNGYPSGGNYWDSYSGADLYSGYYQNETGGDGIGDTGYQWDRYPLMNPWDSPQPPIAIFTYSPQHAIVGEAVYFNASASDDRDGFIVSYTWDFGDDNTTTMSNSFIWHVYTASGNYTVKLKVTDNDGQSHDATKFVTVKLYRSTITLSVDHALVAVGSNVTINGIITPARVDVNVTLFYRPSSGLWEALAEVKTDFSSSYTYTWHIADVGSYEIKAAWLGDENTWPAESYIKTVATRVAINADGSIDPSGVPISRYGNLYTLTGDIFATIVVGRDNIVIDGAGYTIQGISTGKGIDISYRSNVTVKNIKVIRFEHGICLYFSSPSVLLPGNAIINSTVRNNTYGISLYYSDYNTVSDNTITNNICGIAIFSGLGWDFSTDNLVQNSDISNNAESGIYLTGYLGASVVKGNRLTQNKNGISGGGSAYGVCIRDNTFQSRENGIHLSAANIANIDIVNNTILSDGNGIYLHYEDSTDIDLWDIEILSNSIVASGKGICIYAKSYLYIYWSYGSGSGSAEINNISVLNNSIVSAGDGIQLYAYGYVYYAYYGWLWGTASIYKIKISENSVSSLQNGISLSAIGYGDALVGSIEITSNLVQSSGKGIYVYGYSASDVTVNGIRLLNNSISSEDKEIQLDAYAPDLYINSNLIQPVAQFIHTPEHPLPGQVTILDASASYDLDGAVANYTWDFGDGNVTTVIDPAIMHTYTSDGVFVVNLTVTDNNGYTESETKTITIDSTPPTTLHDYNGLWHTADLTINLNATDTVSGTAETYYKINDGPTRAVSTDGQPLITTEGVNTLEYWSVDNIGNEETHHILTGIKLDKTAPIGSIEINDDATYSTSTSVTLTLTAGDAAAGVYQVRFSNDGVWDTELWETSSSSRAWTLTFGDGTKTVYYQIKDNAGLVSITYSDTIILDTVPPTGSITIAGGATYTNSTSATLTLSSNDAGSGVVQMRFSHDNITWTLWETYSTSKSWTLTPGDGTKTIYVQFMDNAGFISPSYQDTITLDTAIPIAKAGADQTVNEDTLVTFDASASTDENGIATYTWTFTDLTPQTLTGKNPTYTFATPGTYRITLKVTDPAGNSATDTFTLTVLDITKPTANAGPDRTVNEDIQVTLDGSASSDNVGITAHTWMFTDVTTKTLTGERPTYTFSMPGVYTITLNVTDAAGNWATDTIALTVLDITKPVANAGQDQTVNVGTAVSFDAGNSSDNVDIVSYEWNFGDGVTGTGKTTSHTYTTAGTYTVTLTVKDAADNTASDSLTITVRSDGQPLPSAEAFPMWAISAAILALGIALATIVFLRKRRS